jgi:DNA-binding NtrC family response regulator
MGARNARRHALVADDSEAVRAQLSGWLEHRGFKVDTVADGRRALALIDSGAAPDIVFLDAWMPELDGLETLSRIREQDPELPVVLFSVDGSARTIVEIMRRGATDFLPKPLDEAELDRLLDRVVGRETPADDAIDRPLWSGRRLVAVQEMLEQIADTNVTVLILGESGVGKEVVARAVHDTSCRRNGPFVKVNCAALPGSLLESELFGYEKGAFTGALARRRGKFESADGGTIFLDEIGEMSPTAQAKLLQVLQDSTFSRLGGNEEIRVDVRVMSATNRRLDEMVAERRFREDLFFRLNVVGIAIPPLRESREEIPKLVSHFIERYSRYFGRPSVVPSKRLMDLFDRHPFPGNVRELENAIKRIVVLGAEHTVVEELAQAGASMAEDDRFASLLEEVEATAGEVPLREVGRRASLEAERVAIRHTLQRTNWNRKRAAELLGVSYKTLLQKIRECALQPDA